MSMLEYIGVIVLILFFIFIHNRRRNRDAIIPNWPIIGMLPSLLHNLSNIHDYITLILKQHGGTLLFEGPWFTNLNYIFTCDPMNVHHITSKNFGNYGKGSSYHEIFEVLGGGSFNSDSHEWKQERTILHSLLKRRSFEIAYEKALLVIEEVLLYRHVTPRFVWNLQKWLRIGQEKKFKVAQENLDQFLHECITYCKHHQQSKCNSIEQVEESPLELKNALMKEGVGKGQTRDKYLRDTAFNLLAAGNGTISVGLSWFFWLVSTHPIVEVKILQEIKDNCSIREENWITSGVEELGKLVYLHGAICEALRLFPPVPFEHKCAVKSDILPNGDLVSPNTKILYFPYSMGRMEQTWGEDCLEFKPERWISEMGHIRHIPSYKFIAFNAGPRSCLGKNFSLIEMKMVASAILWKFHIQVVEGHPVTPRVSIILGMKHGLKVKVTKRCL